MPFEVRKIPVAAVLVAVALIASACGGGRTPSRDAKLETIFEAPGQLGTAPASTLAELRQLGVNDVRVSIPWASVAPDPAAGAAPAGFDATDPAAYPAAGWAPYDAIVRDAQADGIGVLLNPGGPAPQWAVGAGEPPGAVKGAWKPSAPDFGQFVQAVATRYGGTYVPPGSSSSLPHVSFWSIWNEPNYGSDLAPQATDDSSVEVSPALYRALLDSSWQALQATGHGKDTILIGELAPRGILAGNNPATVGIVPLQFLRALYCVDGSLRPLRGMAAAERGCPTDAQGSASFAHDNPVLFRASGVAVHPYPQGIVPPDVPTPFEPDYADLASLPNVERTLDGLQAAYGSATRFPLYSTEFGYITDPPEKLLRAISPSLAAYYLNWSEYITWRNPRLLSYDQYLLEDATTSDFASGIVFADGVPKATYDAFRMPIFLPVTSAASGHSLEVWGCVRPAHSQSTGTQTARIQFRAASSATFRTVRSVTVSSANCYFDVDVAFPGTGLVRLAWAYPNGTEIYSRTVAVAMN